VFTLENTTRGVGEPRHLLLGDGEHPHLVEEAGDLELAGPEPPLHGSETGARVAGVECLVVRPGTRHHHVGLMGARGDEAGHRRGEKRHVTGHGEGGLSRRGLQTGIDAAERAAVGKDIAHHGEAHPRVELRGVGDEEEIVGHLPQDIGHPLDDAAAAHLHQGLGLAPHARAPAARLDHPGELHVRSTARRPISRLNCMPAKRMRSTPA
jgi:hypothetical protein